MDAKRFYGAKTVGIPNLSGSEDENLSDDNFYRKTFSQVLVEDTSEEEQLDREMVEDIVIKESDFSDSEDDVPLSTLIAANKAKKKNKVCFDWEDKQLRVSDEDILFKGSHSLGKDILNLGGIFEFFKFFFTDDILVHIMEQTNLYAIQCRPEKPPNITKEEINILIGICIYMSVAHLPSTRS
ncbi:unnamed protein product [Acanthoscelides obtectus]|uniref:PiggyBac transposable element-derived protein domain-containing protein n=1 Tax=Acanthoscelides obtectus TaxID=200917 RepID=A0A9P0NZU2_ACAOB|nr:unnamed protein product [Acanthoscelides obtectus]CAK1633831.1 hypothetical protein AOBTE_LOCUS8418 [Acanthoscelides obtectus]